jgi:hypothetical protein
MEEDQFLQLVLGHLFKRNKTSFSNERLYLRESGLILAILGQTQPFWS